MQTFSIPAPAADDPVVKAAIEWIILLRSGECSSDERRAFEAWRRADARHDAAVARLEQRLGRFDALPASTEARASARRALLAPSSRRKALRGGAAMLLLAVGSGFVAHRVTPLQNVLADLRTATGERRRIALADGSTLWLNARSAVDVRFDDRQRRLVLQGGELVIDVARDTARPLIVQTREGTMQALGTRFLARQEEGSSVLAVLHSSVRIDTRQGRSAVFGAGQGARFDSAGIVPVEQGVAESAAWTEGFIEVHDRPLGEVVAALRPYRRGFLRVSPQAAALRVTGTFPLDDSERTLAALVETLPIAVYRRTDYWVTIEAL